jgi:hypothetical protein
MNLDADCSLGAFFDLPSSVRDVSHEKLCRIG